MIKLIPIFRIIGFLEGLSYVLLLFIAVPVKYFLNNPDYVRFLGMPHGLLFVAYILLAISMAGKLEWKAKMLSKTLLASIIPFGTFYVDNKYLRKL